MIRPKAFKYKCPNCGYSKIVKPKSDALTPLDFISICPKCNNQMERKELNAVEKIFWR